MRRLFRSTRSGYNPRLPAGYRPMSQRFIPNRDDRRCRGGAARGLCIPGSIATGDR